MIRNAVGDVLSSGATLAISTVSDVSGSVYHQVKIGNQIWTMENWRASKYNDNTDIPKAIPRATAPEYCYYNNTINADSIKKFGALYSWYAVSPTNAKKIAPKGWHVPTDAEWDTLQNWLIAKGYNYDGLTSGNKIAKSMAAKTDWQTSTITGAIGNGLETNNKSGFSALQGGAYTEVFSANHVYWWSATDYDVPHACARHLHHTFKELYREPSYKNYGFSLRLVRD